MELSRIKKDGGREDGETGDNGKFYLEKDEAPLSVSSSSSLLFLPSFFPAHTEAKLTRKMTPPTKNGHAPGPIESRKSCQSVDPDYFDFSQSAEGVNKLTTTNPLATAFAVI